MDLKSYLREQRELVEKYLEEYLPAEDTRPEVIHRSMRYSVFAGGKRLRPILVLAACEAVGGNKMQAMPAACALEMIHTYSLIHDDLPAMDNDDYRRGKLTNHKVFGDGIAVLAGCGLLTYAFQLMVQKMQQVKPETVLRVIEEISQAAGFAGMIAGQTADLEAEGKEISFADLKYIHAHKTGALLRASLRAGAIIGGADDEVLNQISSYAEKIGLAFQIMDDILDLVGDEKKIGKKTGSDLTNNKATYPAFFGLPKSKEMAVDLIEKAKNAVRDLDSEVLPAIADYIIKRDC